MTAKGIIFSAPMVRDLLDGKKTQTRRLLTRANTLFNGDQWPKGLQLEEMRLAEAWVDAGPSPSGNPGPYLKADWPYSRLIDEDDSYDSEWLMARLYPKVQPGDRLWVRENWQGLSYGDYLPTKGRVCDLRYAATDPCADLPADSRGYPWRPSIHMSRWASRLWLSVTEVLVQRLQDINEEDARAEGLGSGEHDGMDPRGWYRDLWNTLYTAPGERWDDNPWIVAVSFDVHHGNIDEALPAPQGGV